MFGLINGVAILLWHLASLESFGVPYLYPLVPFDLVVVKDTFIRLGDLNKRLRILAPFNRMRMSNEGIIHKKEDQSGE
jgi:spore germination protein KA